MYICVINSLRYEKTASINHSISSCIKLML